MALYGFALWLPQLVKASGSFSNFEVGVITAIPYAVAAAGMLLVGRSSDRSGERYLHLALPAVAGAVGFLATSRADGTVMLVAAMSLVAFGVLGWLGPFWALPTAFLREQAAAARQQKAIAALRLARILHQSSCGKRNFTTLKL